MAFATRPLTDLFGAEIIGFDLSAPLSDEDFQKLEKTFYEKSVLLFRDQILEEQAHIDFTRRFGPLIPITYLVPNLKVDPESSDHWLVWFSNLDENGELLPSDDPRMVNTFNANALWHIDGSFRKNPDKVSMLVMEESPPEEGETQFTSLPAAYEALPENRKLELEGLKAEHSFAHSRMGFELTDATQSIIDKYPPVEHPIVRTIPETGKKSLFVASHTSHVVGWPQSDGEALIDELMACCTEPRFRYTHHWKPNDVLIWDNRACLHRGRPWDSGRYKRILRRTTVVGDYSVV